MVEWVSAAVDLGSATRRGKGPSTVTSLVESLLSVPGWLVLVVAGAVVFAEDALFVGFVLPGESAAVLAGVAAKLGHVSLSGVLLTVVAAAVVGDTVGYEVGRLGGARLLRLRVFDQHRDRVLEVQGRLVRRGGTAVFLGRWLAFLRAVTPALAGMARMPYRRFLAFNAAGGLIWGVTVVLLGYAAGASYARVEKSLGRGIAVVAVVVVVVAFVAWRISRHRRADEPDAV